MTIKLKTFLTMRLSQQKARRITILNYLESDEEDQYEGLVQFCKEDLQRIDDDIQECTVCLRALKTHQKQKKAPQRVNQSIT